MIHALRGGCNHLAEFKASCQPEGAEACGRVCPRGKIGMNSLDVSKAWQGNLPGAQASSELQCLFNFVDSIALASRDLNV